jgi:hypothetical protein
MALAPWAADSTVTELFDKVKEKYHLPRLDEATVAVCFVDQKPFNKGRFNWGKVRRFQQIDKLWHPDSKKYDFLIVIPADAWNRVLSGEQREALADLHLSRCSVEYEPVTEEITVRGIVKKKIVKDDWDRVEYTQEIKRDKETDEPKWKILPLDLHVFSENVQRFGVWCEELLNFKEALEDDHDTKITEITEEVKITANAASRYDDEEVVA